MKLIKNRWFLRKEDGASSSGPAPQQQQQQQQQNTETAPEKELARLREENAGLRQENANLRKAGNVTISSKVKEKMAAGLTREQAESVVQQQKEHDEYVAELDAKREEEAAKQEAKTKRK